jgi:hypothetical protein
MKINISILATLLNFDQLKDLPSRRTGPLKIAEAFGKARQFDGDMV